MLRTWLRTVSRLTSSSDAAPPYVIPRTRQRSTSCSRGVRLKDACPHRPRGECAAEVEGALVLARSLGDPSIFGRTLKALPATLLAR